MKRCYLYILKYCPHVYHSLQSSCHSNLQGILNQTLYSIHGIRLFSFFCSCLRYSYQLICDGLIFFNGISTNLWLFYTWGIIFFFFFHVVVEVFFEVTHGPIEYKFLFDGNLTGTTTHSGPGSNDNEGILYSHQIFTSLKGIQSAYFISC